MTLKTYPPNFVTLYADATVSSDGHHSYAFWGRSSWGRTMLAGMCPPEVDGIGQAEMYAICQGMHKCLKVWPTTEGFYICSDSTHALHRLGNPYTTKTARDKDIPDVELRLKRSFDAMVNKHSLMLDMRHVKAHTGKKNIRAYLNQWCDEQSRIAIRRYKNNTIKK